MVLYAALLIAVSSVIFVYSAISPTSLNYDRTAGWVPAVFPVELAVSFSESTDRYDEIELIRTTPTGETTDVTGAWDGSEMRFETFPDYVRDLELRMPQERVSQIDTVFFRLGLQTHRVDSIEELFTPTSALGTGTSVFSLNHDALRINRSRLPGFGHIINFRGDIELVILSFLSALLIVGTLYASLSVPKTVFAVVPPNTGVVIAVVAFGVSGIDSVPAPLAMFSWLYYSVGAMAGVIALSAFAQQLNRVKLLRFTVVFSLLAATVGGFLASVSDSDAILQFQERALPLLVLLFALSSVYLWYSRVTQRSDDIAIADDRLNGRLRVTLGLVILLLVGLALRGPNLGLDEFHDDEFQVMSSAYGYTQSGEYVRWNWISGETGSSYDRAWPHTWLIAQSFELFGFSEASSRIPSLVFGLLFIALSYVVALHFTGSRWIALLIAGLVTISPTYVRYAQWARMYAILLPLFALLVYSSYRAVTEVYVPAFVPRHDKIQAWLRSNFQLHVGFALLALLLLWLNYEIHINSLVIGPAVLLYFVAAYSAAPEQRRRIRIVSIISMVALVAAVALMFSDLFRHSGFVSFFGRRNYGYIDHIFGYPFPGGFGLVLTALTTVYAIRSRKLPLLFVCVLVWFGLVFFVFIGDRYVSFAYTSHLTLFALLTSVVGFALLVDLLPARTARALFIAMAVLVAADSATSIARFHSGPSTPQHSLVYSTLSEKYDPASEEIFALLGRSYYMYQAGITEWSSIPRGREYSLSDLQSDVEAAGSGWIVWESNKYFHLDREVIDYMNDNFRKLYGEGVDDTRVELFYFSVDSD